MTLELRTRWDLRYVESEAVRAIGLPSAAGWRLSRRLDRALTRCGARSPLRDEVRVAVECLTDRGCSPAEASRRLADAVMAHADERGWHQESVVTRAPRASELAADVGRWALQTASARRPSTAG